MLLLKGKTTEFKSTCNDTLHTYGQHRKLIELGGHARQLQLSHVEWYTIGAPSSLEDGRSARLISRIVHRVPLRRVQPEEVLLCERFTQLLQLQQNLRARKKSGVRVRVRVDQPAGHGAGGSAGVWGET